jgi:hypothetical protein
MPARRSTHPAHRGLRAKHCTRQGSPDAGPLASSSGGARQKRDTPFRGLHETSATILLALIGFHAWAALFHGVVLRDGVLRSTPPPRPHVFQK